MSKHAHFALWSDRTPSEPKHSTGWTPEALFADQWPGIAKDLVPAEYHPYAPGMHANPFGKHHPATPITDEIPANNVIALRTAPALDIAA